MQRDTNALTHVDTTKKRIHLNQPSVYFISAAHRLLSVALFLSVWLLANAHAFVLRETVTPFPDPPPEWKIFSDSLTVSPDSSSLACVARNGERMTVMRDGKPMSVFSKIGRATPVYSADSKSMAFTGYRDNRWHMAIDDAVHPGYAAVSDPRFAPRGDRMAYIIRDVSGQAVVVQGQRQGPYFEGIAFKPEHFVFSPDAARLAYVGGDAEGYKPVVDSRPADACDEVATPVFSPDSRRLVWKVKRSGKWHVMEDGDLGPGFDAVGTMVFSPDSRHLAYLATREKKMCVVRGGLIGACFDAAAHPVFSPDSSRFAHIAVEKHRWTVIIDGKAGKSFDQIGAFRFSPDSKRTAYTVRQDDRWLMVVDDSYGPPFEVVSIPVFSPDSRTIAYAAKTTIADSVQWIAVFDDRLGPAFDRITLPFFSPDGKRTGYMAVKDGGWRMVVDGVNGPVYDGLAMPVFSPDAKRLAYLVKQDSTWSVAVDGVQGKIRFLGAVKGARLVFDTGSRLHTLVMGAANEAFARLDVIIADD